MFALRALPLALLLVAMSERAGGALEPAHCAPIAGGVAALEEVDARERLQLIQRRLRHAARRARIWAWTWGGLYSALTTLNLALIGSTNDRGIRNDYYLGAGASAVGVLFIGALPLSVMSDSRWLDRRIARAPAGTDPCALLADAERLLIRDAASEAFGSGPLVHGGSFVFNVGLGLLLAAGFHHFQQATITSLVGISVGELQAFTQPVDVVDDLRRYRQGDFTAPGPPRWWAVTPVAAPNHYGLSASLSF